MSETAAYEKKCSGRRADRQKEKSCRRKGPKEKERIVAECEWREVRAACVIGNAAGGAQPVSITVSCFLVLASLTGAVLQEREEKERAVFL